jgi:hypothetical protein
MMELGRECITSASVNPSEELLTISWAMAGMQMMKSLL